MTPAQKHRRTLGRLAAMLGLLSASAAAVPPAPGLPANYARPALWRIADADTTIYLFGTFHTLDARTVWFDRAVRDAFHQSGELVLETIVPTQPAEVAAAAKPTAFLDGTRAVVRAAQTSGLSVENGADQVLRRLADQSGKRVAGLESFADQLGQLSRIKATVAPAPTAVSAQPVTLADLLLAWKNGDSHAFATMLTGFEAKAPEAYRILIADRNARWADWVAARLAQPGVVFVAVGSGHLAGKDSVQQRLAARGIATTRIG